MPKQPDQKPKTPLPKNPKQDGGKLLGQGVYGCAFTPPLKCRGKAKNPTNVVQDRVGKITSTQDAIFEFNVSQRLRAVPLAPNYFIMSDDICTPDVRTQQDEKDIALCVPLKQQRLPNFKQLSMPFGGTPLYNAKFVLADFDIFEFAKHLLEAGSLLLLSGIVHTDLHMGNILVDNFNVPRVIDFGMAIIPSFVTPEIMTNIQHPPDFKFYQEPPEVSLMWAIKAEVADRDTPLEIIQQKIIFKDIQGFFGKSSNELVAELEAFWIQSKSLQNKSYAEFLKTYWPQYDAWTIGANLLYLLKMLSFYPSFQENPTYSKNKKLLEGVIKKLVEVNPQKRYDAIQALNELDAESYVLKTYASEWLSSRKSHQMQ
jgi:hypothetical protein